MCQLDSMNFIGFGISRYSAWISDDPAFLLSSNLGKIEHSEFWNLLIPGLSHLWCWLELCYPRQSQCTILYSWLLFNDQVAVVARIIFAQFCHVYHCICSWIRQAMLSVTHLQIELLQYVLPAAALEEDPAVSAGAQWVMHLWALLEQYMLHLCSISCIGWQFASGPNSRCWF